MPTTVTFIPNPLLEAEWYASEMAAAALISIGERVVAVAKTLVPVETGELQGSISYALGEDESGHSMVVIGSDVRYAGFVEFGTSRMAAEPYLRPALDEVV